MLRVLVTSILCLIYSSAHAIDQCFIDFTTICHGRTVDVELRNPRFLLYEGSRLNFDCPIPPNLKIPAHEIPNEYGLRGDMFCDRAQILRPNLSSQTQAVNRSPNGTQSQEKFQREKAVLNYCTSAQRDEISNIIESYQIANFLLNLPELANAPLGEFLKLFGAELTTSDIVSLQSFAQNTFSQKWNPARLTKIERCLNSGGRELFCQFLKTDLRTEEYNCIVEIAKSQ